LKAKLISALDFYSFWEENRTGDNLSVCSSDLQCKTVCPATVKKLMMDQTMVYFSK